MILLNKNLTKSLVCFLFSLLAFVSAKAQLTGTYNIKGADTVKVFKPFGSTEFELQNRTRDTLGFLYNIGGGKTIFKHAMKKVNDSTYVFGADTLHLHVNGEVDPVWIADSGNYYVKTVINTLLNTKLNKTDTAAMLSVYLRKVDTTNKWLTSVVRKQGTDSVFYYKGGAAIFAFIDSIGLTTEVDPVWIADSSNYYTKAAANARFADTIYVNPGQFADTLRYQQGNGATHFVDYIDHLDGLVLGGLVSWSGSGLTFDVTQATYYINDTRYNSSAGSVTLPAANVTFDRIDAIALNNLGQIVVIQGVASANPETPQVDPATQIYLTSVYVPAGAVVPLNVATETIYDENTEAWTHTTTVATTNFNNAVNPFHLTKDASIGTWANGNTITFTNTVALNHNNYTNLKMFIRLNATVASTANIRVSFMLGNTVVSNVVTLGAGNGFVKSTVGSYMNITAALSSFAFTSTTFDKVRITLAGAGAGFLLDYVQLQTGISNTTPQNFVTNVFKKPGTDSVFYVINNTNHFAYRDSTATDTNFGNTDINATGDRVHNFKSHSFRIDSLSNFDLYSQDPFNANHTEFQFNPFGLNINYHDDAIDAGQFVGNTYAGLYEQNSDNAHELDVTPTGVIVYNYVYNQRTFFQVGEPGLSGSLGVVYVPKVSDSFNVVSPLKVAVWDNDTLKSTDVSSLISTPNLQQVTDVGFTTTNEIISTARYGFLNKTPINQVLSELYQTSDSTQGRMTLYSTAGAHQTQFFIDSIMMLNAGGLTDSTLTLKYPEFAIMGSYYLPISVNGARADVTGNIDITGSTGRYAIEDNISLQNRSISYGDFGINHFFGDETYVNQEAESFATKTRFWWYVQDNFDDGATNPNNASSFQIRSNNVEMLYSSNFGPNIINTSGVGTTGVYMSNNDANYSAQAFMIVDTGKAMVRYRTSSGTVDKAIIFPVVTSDRYSVLSVNGTFANSAGNIDVTGSTGKFGLQDYFATSDRGFSLRGHSFLIDSGLNIYLHTATVHGEGRVSLEDTTASLYASASGNASVIAATPSQILLQPVGFGSATIGDVWTLTDNTSGAGHWAGGIVPRNITYSSLVTAIAGKTLSAGQKYRLTDYRTTHIIPGTVDTNIASIEVLILTATTDSTLEPMAYSEKYQDDVIYYTPTNDQNVVPGCTKGYIYRRIDKKINNDICNDFRSVKYRRYAASAATYSAGTTYAKNDVAADGTTGEIFISRQNANTGQTLDDFSGVWWLDLGIKNGYFVVAATDFYSTNSSLYTWVDTSSHQDFPLFSDTDYSQGHYYNNTFNYVSNLNISGDNTSASRTGKQNIISIINTTFLRHTAAYNIKTEASSSIQTNTIFGTTDGYSHTGQIRDVDLRNDSHIDDNLIVEGDISRNMLNDASTISTNFLHQGFIYDNTLHNSQINGNLMYGSDIDINNMSLSSINNNATTGSIYELLMFFGHHDGFNDTGIFHKQVLGTSTTTIP